MKFSTESSFSASGISAATTESTILIRPGRSLLRLDLNLTWEYRELLYFLVWRDVKVRYKQTIIGAGWAIVQPLMTMVIFAVIFGNFAKIPSEGFPYSIFTFTALLPWNYLLQAINRSGVSLVGNAGLINKVYFPRLIIPLSAVVTPLVDFAIAFLVLLGMMLWYGITPTSGALALPPLLLLTMLTALAFGLWFSALDVRYRDIGHMIPFLLQCWLYVSPVAYPLSLVPEKWRLLYGLNPIAGIVEGFRWALLGTRSPDVRMIAVSATVVVVLLLGGIFYFRHTENTFADFV